MVLAVLALAWQEASAARLGGGRSFGSKPSMSRPFSKPTPPVSSPTMRQQADQPGQAAAAGMARPGLFGGMGGMLGGLLAGSLLGSLLFGGGFQGGGLLDILLIGGALYLLFKFLARRRAATAGPGHGSAFGGPSYQEPDRQDLRYESTRSQTPRGGLDWSTLSGKAASEPTASASQGSASGRAPAGFDEQDFLNGAKAAYTRLNDAWDRRDLDDIAQFATPAFMNEIRTQADEDPQPSKTEIMLINASFVGVESEGDAEYASVFFSVLLREDPAQNTTTEVREVWHFVRPADGRGNWKVDGIQQVQQ